jgi:peptide/nickel transport system substrate-binding protein
MRMSRKTRVAASAAALVVGASVLAGCSNSGGSSSSASGGTPKQGGTVRVAESPGTYATAIWPFIAPNEYSTADTSEFQYLFYRPLYFWGLNDKIQEDPSVSIGNTPVWSSNGKTVSITLKDWKWSNGESVDGQDVLFWLNMSKAEESKSAYYTPPNTSIGADYYPDNIVSATASGQTVTLNLDKAYNQTWFDDNQLSIITPMPLAWDLTSATAKGSCATATFGSAAATTACDADYNYLSKLSTDGATFATNPLWQIVDGPWRLKTYNSTSGAYSIVPNSDYSGPQKPYLDEVDYVPFTSDTAEYAQLKAGSTGANAIQVGYTDSADLPKYDASNLNSDNPLKNKGYYFATPYELDDISYYQVNEGNTTVGALFKQPYFMQAVQDTVDQQGIITGFEKGWAYPTTAAVPSEPSGNPLSPAAKALKLSFSTSTAKALLAANGWDTSTSPATCTKPGTGAGECGAGITAGEAASFTLDYPSGEGTVQQEATLMASDAAEAGVKINAVGQTQNQIGNEGSACAASTGSGCWEGLLYGGWVYSPDYYPTGDGLFATGAGANIWGASNPTLDSLIYKTTISNSISDMYAYEDYIDSHQQVIYMPNGLQQQGTEVVTGLNIGVSDPFQGAEPEYWYYEK